MRKIIPEELQGIEFVRLSSLPFNQVAALQEWLGAADVFSIHHQNGVITDCVRYDDYDFWFDHVNDERNSFEYTFF